ncbi:MAG: MFS transporter [Euryarchaeota archaeon]|nr:MFS transporter [Euryarchaeota archaeon]
MTASANGLIGRIRALPPQAWRLVTLAAFVSVANGIFLFSFVLFMLRLGHGTGLQGVLLSLMEVSVALTILPFGMLAPRAGKRRMLFSGLALTAASYVCVALSTELWHFVPGMLLLGLGTSLVTPVISTALADTACDADRKYLMSINAFGMMLSGALGFYLSGLFVGLVGEESGFRLLFWFAGGIVLAGAVLLTRRPEGPCAPAPRTGGGTRALLPFVLPQFVLGLGAGLVIPFFPVYFKLRFSADTATISALFTATQLFWAATYMAMPVIAERRGSVRTLVFMQAMAVAALFAIPLTADFGSTAFLFAVRMILMNASRPIADSYMMTLVGKDLRSTAVAANQLAWMLPHMLSVAAGGALMAFNPEVPFLVCGLLYILSTALYAWFFMKRDDVGKRGQ